MWRKQGEPKPSAAMDTPSLPVVERPPLVSEPRGEVTHVSRAITVKGEIFGREDLFIDGEVEGTVRVPEAGVTVGPNGRVTAEIEANDIVVEGSVKGNLRGRDRVWIRRSASVTGDVVTHRIVIEEGAFFKGSIDIARPDEVRAATKPRDAGVAVGGEAFRAFRFGAKDQPQ